MVRKIIYAFDTEYSKVINLDTLIQSKPDGFVVRMDYNNNRNRFKCLECNQILVASYSKNDNVYFRHSHNSDLCILKEIGNDLFAIYETRAHERESPRHKEIKNEIGRLLKNETYVDKDSIDIDSTFIIGVNGDKRRPDVYCEFNGKKIAFEIQLSYLPLHYIKHRYKFYKENNIYLFWVFDSLASPKVLVSFQRDIKYTEGHQNLFFLNSDDKIKLSFECHFKAVYLIECLKIHERWSQKSVYLTDLTFNDEEYTCYYYSTSNETELLKKQIPFLEEERQKQFLLEVSRKRKEKIEKIINDIRKKNERDSSFYYLFDEIEKLDFESVQELNTVLNLNRITNDGIPLVLFYIKHYKKHSPKNGFNLIKFLIETMNIKYDINQRDKDGLSILYYLFSNPDIEVDFYQLEPFLFKRGLLLDDIDEKFLKDKFSDKYLDKYLRYSHYQACDYKEEYDFVQNNNRLLLFIESAIHLKIIGSNLKNWVQYTVPIIATYQNYWGYIKIALNKTELGNILRGVDKKETINKKIKEYRLIDDCSDSMVSSLLFKLFPEIYG